MDPSDDPSLHGSPEDREKLRTFQNIIRFIELHDELPEFYADDEFEIYDENEEPKPEKEEEDEEEAPPLPPKAKKPKKGFFDLFEREKEEPSNVDLSGVELEYEAFVDGSKKINPGDPGYEEIPSEVRTWIDEENEKIKSQLGLKFPEFDVKEMERLLKEKEEQNPPIRMKYGPRIFRPEQQLLRDQKDFTFQNMREWLSSVDMGSIEGSESFRFRIMRARFQMVEKAINDYKKRGNKPPVGLALDDLYWRDPTSKKCITNNTRYNVTHSVIHWYSYVSDLIDKYDRKLKIEKYKKENKIDGLWCSPIGNFLSQIFPKFCGLDMENPPPYYDIITPEDRRCYYSFEMAHQATRYRTGFFAGCAAAACTVVGQFLGPRFGLSRQLMPSFWRKPWLGLKAAIPFMIGGYLICNYHTRKKNVIAIDNMLHTTGCFMGAKFRKIADDVMYPASLHHNRFYLEMLPRDDWDSFVWSVEDEDIAFGRFEDRWAWARKENRAKDPNFWSLPYSLKLKWMRGLFEEAIFKKYQQWNKNILEIRNLLGNPVTRQIEQNQTKIQPPIFDPQFEHD